MVESGEAVPKVVRLFDVERTTIYGTLQRAAPRP